MSELHISKFLEKKYNHKFTPSLFGYNLKLFSKLESPYGLMAKLRPPPPINGDEIK